MDNEEERRGLLDKDEPEAGSDLDLYEVNTYSFILKIWLESRAKEGQPAEWSGAITDVLSTERRHFRSLREMIDHLSPYLEKLGIEDPLLLPSKDN